MSSSHAFIRPKGGGRQEAFPQNVKAGKVGGKHIFLEWKFQSHS